MDNLIQEAGWTCKENRFIDTLSPEEIKLRYESLLVNNSDGILECNILGEIISVNPACERLLGFTANELTDTMLDDLVVSGGEHNLSRDGYTGDSLWKHKSGEFIHVKQKNVPIVVNGRVVGVHTIIQDVTEEQMIRDDLLNAKEQLQTIFDTLDVSLWSQEFPSGKVTYMSPSSEKIWSVPLETLVTDTSAWLQLVHPSDVDWVCEKLNEVRRGTPFIYDYRLIHPDGEIHWVHDRVIPIVRDDGILTRVIGIAVDITPLKTAEEDRLKTNQLLQRSEALSTLGQLAAGIAHEIRNPLTSLIGFMQLVQPMIPNEYSTIMISELKRISSIVSEFLMLAKPQQVQNQPHDLKRIIKHTVAFFKGQTNLNNVSIVSKFQPGLCSILCKESQIKQVLINLLKNAIEAMPSGGRIELKLKMTRDHEVLVNISDEGSGIPDDVIRRLGEPFFTTKQDGTGLGLLITQQIIASHGGRMLVQSRVNQGTTVSVILPMV
jgi:two-component system, sporulation sensor kinase A